MAVKENPSENDKWITFRTRSRRVTGPLMQQKENSVKSIQEKIIEKGCMTLLQGVPPNHILTLKRIFQHQSGGCIFVHGNMFEIFNRDVSENVSNIYDAVIITNERPVCVVTIIEDGVSDEDAKDHNEILSNKVQRSLLMFTDRNITTVCTVVKGSNLKEDELLSKLDDAIKEEAQLTNPDKLYMDERKMNDVTTAFITCLAFMTNPPVQSDIPSNIPGRDVTLRCMTLSAFEKKYSVLASEERGNEPQTEDVKRVFKKPDSTAQPKNRHCRPLPDSQKTLQLNPSHIPLLVK